jgi:hypothetical protein
MPIPAETRTMKAYRQDGTEVQAGDVITDFRADHTDVFYAATRVTEFGVGGKIQVRDPFGPEYYAAGFGLTVRYANPVPVIQSACCQDFAPVSHTPASERRMIGYLESRDCHGDRTGRDGCESVNECPTCYGQAGEELARLRASADLALRFGPRAVGGQVRITGGPYAGETGHITRVPGTATIVVRAAGRHLLVGQENAEVTTPPHPSAVAGALAVVQDNRAELMAAQADSPEDGASSERDAYLGALENLAELVQAELGKADPDEAERMAAEAAEAARTMAPPVPGVTENMGYVMFTVIDGERGGTGLLRSWYVAGQREDGACAVWTAYQGENGTLSYDCGSYVTRADRATARRMASLTAAKRAGVLTTLTEYVADASGVLARFGTSYDAAFAELNDVQGLARVKTRTALLEAAAFGRAAVSGSGGRTWTVHYDRMRCVLSVQQDS